MLQIRADTPTLLHLLYISTPLFPSCFPFSSSFLKKAHHQSIAALFLIVRVGNSTSQTQHDFVLYTIYIQFSNLEPG